uniref:N-acetylglucosamine-specific PTS transporter subunit IIBC n=1 Tax=Tessaracoccus timonensis TaxID=2161816 RepID=UPI000D55C3AA|nr:N-acetylglucosamine-specific PTS transporter subunit IIBC [Tessaracoccus timonensis]
MNVMQSLQRLGKALMGAVAVMPVAAILMGIGYWIDPVGWGSESIVAAILIKAGSAILDYLGWIFAIAIAYGLAKDSNGASALAGFIGYGTVTALLGEKAVAGYQGIDLEKLAGADKLAWIAEGWSKMNNGNVLVGILVGVLAAWTYNKFHSTKLPDALAFFSGRRLVPIMMSFFSMILSGILYFVWPLLYSILFHFGQWIVGQGAIGAGIYGFFNRLLIPTGLHHALNQIFWFDVAGINDIGDFLGGAKTIEAAKAATDAASCPGVWDAAAKSCEVIGNVGMYQAGFFPVMMFGLPAAALAIYLRADSKRKKAVGSLMLAGALASFFTGVTEPLEFSFMFVAPLLYVVHAILTGLSVAVAAFFQWTAGFGFSAGFVDMFLSSQNPIANKWYMLLVQGLVWAVAYFAIFYFLIPALNLKTPGRGDDTDEGAELSTDAESDEVASQIIKGLGGADNIDTLDYCATRLRVGINDYTLVSESEIKKAGVAGVIRPSQKSVQVVIGPKVQFVYDAAAAQLRHSDAALHGEQEL